MEKWLLAAVILMNLQTFGFGEDPASISESPFHREVQPFLAKYCLGCHGAEKQDASLNLSTTVSMESILSNPDLWEVILKRIEAREMPPSDASAQPSDAERQSVVQWLHQVRNAEANRRAGDPGFVPARRLSNAELDNSIRDLTGVDIRPTKEFPVDPANEAGFDNSGESLFMSPALLQKYLEAAASVADHAVFTPRDVVFAPYPVITDTDRDRFCVQRIVDFYKRHEVQYARYFMALWKAGREQHASPSGLLQLAAEESGLSLKYMTRLHEMLIQPEAIGPQKEVQDLWKQFPTDAAQSEKAESLSRQISQLIAEIRQDLEVPVERLRIEGVSAGSQPLILRWNQQVAEGRMTFPGDGENAPLDAARNAFCQLFPSAFSVSSRGHYSNSSLGADVRLLSAGFHLMHGYFRDDQPLKTLVLSDAEITELDALWEDLDFVTLAPVRQYKDFLFFERAEPPQFAGGEEFTFARPENKDVTSASMVMRLRETYLKKIEQNAAGPGATDAVDAYFLNMNDRFRWLEETQSKAEQRHLEWLCDFTQRAWRRPLTMSEKDSLVTFYRRLRESENLSHADAMRDSISSVLVSPHFSYRFNSVADHASAADEASEIQPLTDYELASRLSYFLWASIPDAELLTCATEGQLREPAILAAQTRRMLKDRKARGLAVEFLGNWLEFRRFEEHNTVDRTRYPAFNDELRSAMFEEPVQFFMDLIHRDGSVLELVSGHHTFVNKALAAHYGFDFSQSSGENGPETWVRIDDATTHDRGGLLPMSVFLTRNSPGLRTSPVKRGYWIAKRVLGEHIPPPPPNVPELPGDEADFGDLSLAQLMARHRDNVACAGCHQKFDSFGIAFEAFGPIGERRLVDLSGHPVQTDAVFPDGSQGHGFDDLRSYLTTVRRDDFIKNLTRKLFEYGLGRRLLLSDTPAVESTFSQLSEGQYRISIIVESIVSSPQFLNKRISPQ